MDTASKCRAVIVTKDGKRYLTPWRKSMVTALRAAERLAARKELEVKQINGIAMKRVAMKRVSNLAAKEN